MHVPYLIKHIPYHARSHTRVCVRAHTHKHKHANTRTRTHTGGKAWTQTKTDLENDSTGSEDSPSDTRPEGKHLV